MPRSRRPPPRSTSTSTARGDCALGHRLGDLGDGRRLGRRASAPRRQPEPARGQHAAPPLLVEGLVARCGRACRSRSIRSPTSHCSRPSSSTGSPSATSSPSSSGRRSEPVAQELLDRVLEEGRPGRRARRRRRGAAAGRRSPGTPTGAAVAGGGAGARRARQRSKENGARRSRLRRVEGLQRVLAQCVRPAAGGGGVERVEQLAERYGGRPRLARGLVGAGVGDHEVLGRREDRVEHQLAVLAAEVALAGERGAGEHVVAVDGPARGKTPSSRPSRQTTRCGHRPHRHQRADGQGAGAEVGPGRAAGEPLAHQGAHVGQPQLERRPRRAASPASAASSRWTWAGLPLVTAGDGGQRVETPSPTASSQWSTGWLPVSRSVTAAAGRGTRPSRPARSMLVLPTSSSGSVVPNEPARRRRTPPRRRGSGRDRSARCSGRSRRARTAPRCSASKAQRMPACSTQPVIVSRS